MKFERRVALFTGVIVVLFVLFLVYRDQPFSDPNLVVILRVVLSLAVGLLGATIPGVLNVNYDSKGFAIRAAGALGLFAISFFGTPTVQSLKLDTVAISLDQIDDLAEENFLVEAKRSLDKLVKKHPERADVWNMKGKLCVKSIEYDCALTSFEKAVEYAADTEQKNRYLHNLGFAQSATHAFEGAVETYQSLLDFHEEEEVSDRATVYNLSVALTHLNRMVEARTHLTWLYGSSTGADYRAVAKYLLGVGWLVDSPNNVENAIRDFRTAISIENDIRTLVLGTKENIQIDGQSFYFGLSVKKIQKNMGSTCFASFVDELRNGKIDWTDDDPISCS